MEGETESFDELADDGLAASVALGHEGLVVAALAVDVVFFLVVSDLGDHFLAGEATEAIGVVDLGGVGQGQVGVLLNGFIASAAGLSLGTVVFVEFGLSGRSLGTGRRRREVHLLWLIINFYIVRIYTLHLV